ncbi:unnamed protein product [Leptosia nina]|uniref:Uncharacterized protein n=1 Tax=Leptosia nina TaxID=320188 RepID=A0AAV1JTX4_9NEOP
MTILLYDYRELEEKAATQLKAWKVWHLIIFALAGGFGILNYVFLQNTMDLVDNNCVLFPRQLSFKMIDVPIGNTNPNVGNVDAQNAVHIDNATDVKAREIAENATNTNKRDMTSISDDSAQRVEERLVLDTSRTLFGRDTDCEFAEYMPVISLIFAAAWATMFTMCPGGGQPRSGLPQPWRILAPALIFALVMVGLTGHSFTRINAGLVEFCSAFYNVTNTTSCSALDAHLERSWSASWSFAGRAAATRAVSAGVWASWACAATLFLVRCLAAPDFKVRRTGAYLKDPQNKVTPYLNKPRRQISKESPSKPDMTSLRSEPTITTELVTVSIEQDQDTAPTSLQVTPIKTPKKESIELKSPPHILD